MIKSVGDSVESIVEGIAEKKKKKMVTSPFSFSHDVLEKLLYSDR